MLAEISAVNETIKQILRNNIFIVLSFMNHCPFKHITWSKLLSCVSCNLVLSRECRPRDFPLEIPFWRTLRACKKHLSSYLLTIVVQRCLKGWWSGNSMFFSFVGLKELKGCYFKELFYSCPRCYRWSLRLLFLPTRICSFLMFYLIHLKDAHGTGCFSAHRVCIDW